MMLNARDQACDALEWAKNIRLLVVDIDGTCTNAAGETSEDVCRVLRMIQKRGVSVAVATGRSHQSASEFHALIGSMLPLISYDGALVMTGSDRRVCRSWSISAASARALLELSEQIEFHGRIDVHAHVAGDIYVSVPSAISKGFSKRWDLKIDELDSLAEIADAGLVQLTLLADNSEVLFEFRAAAADFLRKTEGLHMSAVSALGQPDCEDRVVRISSMLADKGRAVAYLAEDVMGLDRRQVMTIGDELNDRGMLEYAGIGIAMGQSPGAVKKVADWIAPTIEDDGVAAAIEVWLGR